MNIQRSNERGGILLIVLISSLIMGITLASYLQYTSTQTRSIMRSQAWNTAIPIAEAGIEEALAHLNRNGTNRITDGWVLAPDGTNVVKERVLGDAKYRVFINILKEPPVVLAEAYVKLPGKEEYMRPRVIRTGTKVDALFSKSLVAKDGIDMNGNNVATDSFDSSDPAYNTGGRYDSAKAKDNGDVATNGQVINVGNADIYGKVATGPGGTVNVGSNGSVGSKAWHAAGRSGIEPGWARDDMNMEFPDVQVPFTTGWSVGSSGGNLTVGSGDYLQNGGLSLGGQKKLVVTGNARLYVKGNLSFSGQAYIEIQPGASLELYVGGASASLSGNGIMNLNQTASTFSYWGLPGNTSISLSGNAAFTGTIYAPQASLHMGGGGGNSYDCVGAAIVDSVQMNGHFKFHYDEALGKFGPRKGYLISSWNETIGWEEL